MSNGTRARRRTLVTGATGFLGRHLLGVLGANKRRPLRILDRAAPGSFAPAGSETIVGSVLDRATVRRAVRGCDRIYHLAGRVSRRREDARDLYQLHVEGTRLLCEEAVSAGVRRVVVMSSSGTIAVSDDPDHLATEDSGHALDAVRRWPYYLSKIYQEHEALRFHERDELEVVIVNPSLLLGPGDERGSSTEDVARFLRGEVPVVPSGGMSFVDARDVAATLPVAMERGRSGERYLLAAANWPLTRFLDRLSQLSGVSGPRWKLSPRLTTLGSRVVDVLEQLGAGAKLDPVSTEMAAAFWYVDSSKAIRELGFAPRDPSETLLDTIRDLRERRTGEEHPWP